MLSHQCKLCTTITETVNVEVELQKLQKKVEKLTKPLQTLKERMIQPQYQQQVSAEIQQRDKTRHDQLETEMKEVMNSIETLKLQQK